MLSRNVICYTIRQSLQHFTLFKLIKVQKWTKHLHVSYTVPFYKRQVTVKCGAIQACNQGVQLSAVHSLQTWMHTLEICTISKISPLKDMWHTNTSKCCLFWTIAVGNNSFSKITVQYARCFVQFCAACYIYIYLRLILWSWQSRFLHLYIQNIYTQDLYNRPLYTYITMCIYVVSLEAAAPAVFKCWLWALCNSYHTFQLLCS